MFGILQCLFAVRQAIPSDASWNDSWFDPEEITGMMKVSLGPSREWDEYKCSLEVYLIMLEWRQI